MPISTPFSHPTGPHDHGRQALTVCVPEWTHPDAPGGWAGWWVVLACSVLFSETDVPVTADLSTVETALMAIAIASSVQALVLMGLAVGAVLAWRRLRGAASGHLGEFHARLDEIAHHVGVGMRALDRTADSAARLGEDTGKVVRNVAAVTMPGTLIAATALRQASRFIGKWRREP